MDVLVVDEDVELGEEHETQFYTCHVCGDNWLAVKEPLDEVTAQITFIHQMGMDPVLKRVASVTEVEIQADPEETQWDYFVDDEHIAEDDWRERLLSRRQTLRSICSN